MKDYSLSGPKAFPKVCALIRNRFVYGFRSQEDNARESGHSDNSQNKYDQKIGEWLKGYQVKDPHPSDEGGYVMHIYAAGSEIVVNPLYQAFHASTIKEKWLIMHFYILDFLRGQENGQPLTITELEGMLNEAIDKDSSKDDSKDRIKTLRSFLAKYTEWGILNKTPKGYTLSEDVPLPPADAILFATEQQPLGVIGSFLLNRYDSIPDDLRFKHHNLLGALDSMVLFDLLLAINTHSPVAIRKEADPSREPIRLIPYRFYFGTQTGRQYVLGCDTEKKRPIMLRLDRIRSAEPLPEEPEATPDQSMMDAYESHLWNVSADPGMQTKHLEMTLRIGDDEPYVLNRLDREKKHGTVEQAGENLWRFSIDVFDPLEMMPWIRTFTGRIVDLRCPEDPRIVERFLTHLHQQLSAYGVNADEE